MYSFHNRKQRQLSFSNKLTATQSTSATNTPSSSQSSFSASQTKSLILGGYDKLQQLKTTNPEIKYLSQTQTEISKQIVDTLGILQHSTEKDKTFVTDLHNKLEHLNNLYNKLKSQYDELLKVHLQTVYEHWPEIYDKIIEGVDRNTLEHVLTMYEQQMTGNIDKHTAVNNGIQYMTEKYNLPKDFFNEQAISEFTNN